MERALFVILAFAALMIAMNWPQIFIKDRLKSTQVALRYWTLITIAIAGLLAVGFWLNVVNLFR